MTGTGVCDLWARREGLSRRDQQIPVLDPALDEEFARAPGAGAGCAGAGHGPRCGAGERFGEIPVVYGRDGDAIAAVLPVD